MTESPLHEDPGFRPIVDLFIEELPQRAARLRSTAVAWNRTDARTMAHQLKGAGGGYGFAEISELAAAVEALCVEQTPQEDLLRSVDRLTRECERAVEGWAAE